MLPDNREYHIIRG